jgi:hypothetical protein
VAGLEFRTHWKGLQAANMLPCQVLCFIIQKKLAASKHRELQLRQAVSVAGSGPKAWLAAAAKLSVLPDQAQNPGSQLPLRYQCCRIRPKSLARSCRKAVIVAGSGPTAWLTAAAKLSVLPGQVQKPGSQLPLSCQRCRSTPQNTLAGKTIAS